MGKKKNKKTVLIATLLAICMLPALALLKTSVFGKEKNAIITDNTARYYIIADLDGGKFELGTKPEFTKMDNGKWLHKYKPTMLPTKIPKPVKDGYTFVGWTLEGETTPKPEYSIPSWNRKNINLKANWKAADSVLLPGTKFNRAITSMPEFKNVTEVNFIKGALDTDGIDLSASQDKSIIGSISDNVLTIRCAGKIYANQDCSKMFEFLFRLVNINFNNFNTSEVTNMSRMFYSCYRLSKLDVANFNTSNVTDMSEMFYNCAEVLDFNLNKFDTSNVTNMNNMFRYCYKLNSPNLKSFNTSNVEDMSYMFSGCTNLTNLDVTNFNTSKVTNMSMMFGDTKLIELDISNFNTSNVTNMDGMFYNIKQLTKLDISNFDTSNVTNMSDMFSLCESLGELDVSKFNTSKVKDMSRMFNSCIKIVFLDVSNFDTANVTSMSRMFDGCTSLKSLDLNKFTFSKTVETEEMFRSCINLSSEIVISNVSVLNYTRMFQRCSRAANAEFWVKYTSPEAKFLAQKMVNTKTDGDHVYLLEESATLIEGLSFNDIIRGIDGFYNVTKMCFQQKSGVLSGVDVSEDSDGSIKARIDGDTIYVESNVKIFANIDSWFMFSECSRLTSLDLSNFDTSQVTDMSFMFDGCSRLTSLDLSNFDTSQVTDMCDMFDGCSSLTSLDLSNFDTSQVIDMSFMFDGCSSLTSLNISGFNTSQVADMRQMFRNCSGLTSLVLSSFNTSQVTDMSYMFNGCSGLTSLNVGSFNTSQVTDMSAMFYNCSSLTSLNLSKFNTSQVTDMSYMFNGCSGLTSLVLSNFDTSQVTDMQHMFNGCSGLASLDLSNFNTSKVTRMDNIFAYCSSLITLDVSNFDTSQVTNMSEMFYRCLAVKNLDLSSFSTLNVVDMSRMFSACRYLEHVVGLDTFNTTKVEYMTEMFFYDDFINGSIIIMNPNIINYVNMFRMSCMYSDFTVNYTEGCELIAEDMINTSEYNLVNLGVLVPKPVSVSLSYSIRTLFKSMFNPADAYNEPSANSDSATTQETSPQKDASVQQINITLNNGSMAMYPTEVRRIPAGKVGDLDTPDLNPKYSGQFGGYYYDKNCTIPVKPNDIITQDIELYAKW